MFRETQRNGAIKARTNCKHTIVCFMLLLCIFCSTTQAQILYGSLTGNVTDQTNAVVPQAHVQARNVGTGVMRSTETDSNGIYRFPELQPGTYKVSYSAPNFTTVVVENVRVEVNAVRRLDTRLKVAAATQSVEVTAAPALLQTDRADVHTNIDAAQIENLPITSSEGRSWQSLYNLVPGASPTAEANSQAGNPQRAMNTNVNGGSNQNNNTRIDGAQNAYPWLPANVAYVPPADAIETVNIVTNSFDAEQGMAGGMAANVQIKSGTNQFHGNVHEFHTDQDLRAENYFQPQTLTIGTQSVPFNKPKDIQNQWGGIIGGPIKKDKLFFFGDYERTTERKIAFKTLSVATDAMRNGDFSALIPAGADCNAAPPAGQTRPAGCIFDPNTGNASGQNRLAFPGNIIPANRFDPAALAMIRLMPEPNLAVANSLQPANNYLASGNQQFTRDNADLKINFVPSSRSTLFGRYSYSQSFIFDPPTLGAAGGDALNNGQLGNAFSRIQSAVIGGTYTITPNLLFDGNFGYTRQRLNAEALDIGTNFGLDTLHIPGTNGSSRLQGGIPAMQFNTWSNMGNPNTGNPFLFRDNQWVSNGNLGWTRGKHGFRFGMEYNRSGINHFQPQGGNFQTARGSFRFNGSSTELNGGGAAAVNQATSWADFMLGLAAETGQAVQNANPNSLRWTQIAMYARDQWQVLPSLTVTYGMRWEYYPFVTSDHGGARMLDPSTMNVLIGGHGGVPLDDGVKVGIGEFLPRLGVAWRATNKTVVRAGYGISADPNNWRFFRNAFPAVTISDFTGVGGQFFEPAASLTGTNATLTPLGAIPIGIGSITVPDLTLGTIPLPDAVGTTTAAKNFRRGYTHSFNLTIGQEFAGFVADVGYVGSRSIRPLTNLNINPGPIGGSQNGRLLNAQFGHISTNINPATGKAYRGWPDINSLTPFGNSYYDSLQAKVIRKLGGSSFIGLSYTYSKALDFSDNEELNFLLFPYPAYQRLNKGLASYDRPQNIKLYGVYELPFGRGKRWAQSGVWNTLAGGWQTNWILSKVSGSPFTVTANNGAFNAPGNTETADLIAPLHILGNQPMLGCGSLPTAAAKLPCSYFDQSSFAAPTTARFGNTGRDQFRGPGFFNLDLSLFRKFKLTERVGFEFRAEAFGLTNTPHFFNPPNPNGTTVGNANFGIINQSNGERAVWFGGTLKF